MGNCQSLVFALIIVSISCFSQNQFTLENIIDLAKNRSLRSKQAETEKETNYWKYKYFTTDFKPQLSLRGSAPAFVNSITAIRQPDGSIIYIPINQVNPGLNFGLQQPIPISGGNVSVNTNYNYFNNYEKRFTQWNGSILSIRLNQPIFAFNPLKWDKLTKPILYEESRREYAEKLESIAVDAVSLFFGVLQSQVNRQIANYNMANNDTIHKIEQARYKIGTTSLDKLLQVELQSLRSQQDVAQANLDLETALLHLQMYIGSKEETVSELVIPNLIPEFEIDLESALQYARMNRSDYVAFERRRLEAESYVAKAKGDRFNASLSASYGLNNVGGLLGDLYVAPTKQQIIDVSFNIPIIDWGRRKAQMQMAYANKKLNDYIINQDQVNFEQEIITLVNQFRMLRLQLNITKKSDELAKMRYNEAQKSYLLGKTDITNLNIALGEKDNARRSYILALKSFWTAYYNLRKLTLYDFAEQSLLYKPE